MTLQRARFTSPTRGEGSKQAEMELPVTGGLHSGIPAQNLPAQYSPDLRNLVVSDSGHATPRSGLSRYEPFNFNGVVLGAKDAFDSTGNVGGVAFSAQNVSFQHPTNAAWSSLSYLPGTVATWSRGNLSGTSTDYFDAETIFEPIGERMITVFSNNTDSLKFFEFGSSSVTFSDFTWVDSISSTKACKALASINDRLVLFNVLTSDATRFPSRVMWSARGNPLSYLIADGAGAEDLKDMRGAGTACIRFKDFLLLFTELEIWRATPTLDDYAFRFDRVIDSVGTPYTKTAVTTPAGVVYLGRDLEVYVTNGSAHIPLGPVDADGPSRIQNKLRFEALNLSRAWGVYNQSENRYELYYSASDSPNGWPSRALFFDFRTKTWWPQLFTHGLSAGADLNDTSTLVTWEDVQDSWAVTTAEWDSYAVVQGNRRMNVFTSDSSALRYSSTQTNDSGSTIDVRWRSKGLKAGTRKVHLTELWVDYETESASSASIWIGSALSGSVFTAERAISLTGVNDPLFVPVWTTDHHPSFEIRLNDGGQPKIASFTATLQDGSKF